MYELINSPTTNSEYSLETKFTDADTIPSIPIESVWLVAVGSYIIIPPLPSWYYCEAWCLQSLKQEYLSMSNVDTISVDSSIWPKYNFISKDRIYLKL